MLPRHLVLFDIDGTLLLPDGAGRAALKAALLQVYGTAGAADTFALGGSLDRRTVRTLMTEAGVADAVIWARFAELERVMAADLRKRIAAGMHQVRPCPGAQALLDELSRRQDVLLGLITGNFRSTAEVKLEAAGFDPARFRVGAFGDEAEERSDLPPLAVARAYAATGVAFTGQQVTIIGDTVSDILCGRTVGARSIAVMTGWARPEELVAAQPDYLFADLTDLQGVLEAILARPASPDWPANV